MDSSNLIAPMLTWVQSGITMQRCEVPHPQPQDTAFWDALFQLAASHCLVPLLHAGLSVCGVTPSPKFASMANLQVCASKIRSNCAWKQLSSVVAAFNREGLDIMLLKGALLDHHYYPTAGLRLYGDLDIMVPLSSIEHAEEILLRVGYLAASKEATKQRGKDWYHNHHHHWVYTLDGGLCLELHWGITPPCSQIHLDMNALWQHAQRRLCFGGHILALAPEDEIVSLAVHAAKHQLRVPLRHYFDLVALVASVQEVDWQYVRQMAIDSKAEMDVAVSIGIARQLGLLSLPPEIGIWLDKLPQQSIIFPDLAHHAIHWLDLDPPAILFTLLSQVSFRSVARTLYKIVLPGKRHLMALQHETSAQSHAPQGSVGLRIAHLRRLYKRLGRLMKKWKSLRSAIAIHQLFANREAP